MFIFNENEDITSMYSSRENLEDRKIREQAELHHYCEKAYRFQDEIEKVIKGKSDKVEMVLTAMFAGGHILLEDHPGVGKTTLAKAIRNASELDYKRIQFTPDTMPSDISGFAMYVKEKDQFVVKKGPIFTNLLLGDEINRTSPKTQAALLEAMEERSVTLEGKTMALPDPFIVIATENPSGISGGTQALPDSQKDRFMIRLSMGYMAPENEVEMLKGHTADLYKSEERVLTMDDLKNIREIVKNYIQIDDSVLEYIVALANAIRNHEDVKTGLSHRSSLALRDMAKARAFMKCRRFVTPEDVAYVYESVIAHRLYISNAARARGINESDIVWEVLQKVPQPSVVKKWKRG